MPYADPERRRQYMREYVAAHRKQGRERYRKWYAAHRDEINQCNRERPADAPERVRWREANRKYRTSRPGQKQAKQSARDWRTANREQVNEYARKRRARVNGVQTIPFTAAQWAAKASYWGDRCWVCGGVWVEIDHVKPVAAGGSHALCNLRPACRSCNASKKDRWPLVDVLGVHRRPPSVAA